MQRRRERLPEAIGDLANWPGVDISDLPAATRDTFRARQAALRRYLKGEPLVSIEQRTAVARQQIYRLLKRCATRHTDGRIYGWRALLPHLRTVSYTRTRAVKAGAPGKFGGAAGAMNQLLERYPELEARLQRALTQHELHISASDRLIGLRRVHRQFIAHCRELGLTQRHYPLNQDQLGLRALGQAIRRLATCSFTDAAHAAGATRVGPLRPPDGWPDPAPIQRAFEAVEFDGHKLDIRLRVRLEDPRGLDHDIEIGRCWLLVVLDVATRVVLGWRLAPAAEYDRYDVMQAFIHALQPKRKRKEFVIPGLRYATAEIKQGNTLANPLFTDGDAVKTFDYVVANPPFSDKRWSTGLHQNEGGKASAAGEQSAKDYGRFTGYGIPPAKQGDYAGSGANSWCRSVTLES